MTPAASFPELPGQGSAAPPPRSFAARLPRLICSQNPFYLLSVCFVLHATAQWFNRDSGEGFSPWPLLALIAGYVALLATTGFVIVRFGKVWDDARSILLLILLLFVELSLIFDETLVRDPATGRLLLLAGLAFAACLSELLLLGLKIRLPWRFRVPYHLLLGLLFLYPLLLIAPGPRLSPDDSRWRILLFPVAGAAILLTLIPAIRRGPEYTRVNGTPWHWPWYPWSLFVFLGVCIGFRAYALSLSFDPVLNAPLADALAFQSAFGGYFLIPLVLAAATLLLEVGLVSRRHGAIGLAMSVPIFCLYLAIPAMGSSASYEDFLRQVIRTAGSPLWLTLIAAAVFYGHALLRGVRSAEGLLATTLLLATRVGPRSVDLWEWAPPQLGAAWALCAVLLLAGLVRVDSRRVFIALLIAIGTLAPMLHLPGRNGALVETALLVMLVLTAMLAIGAIYRDDFAWLLRVAGLPLLVMTTLAGVAMRHRLPETLPLWVIALFVMGMTLVALAYAAWAPMRAYQIAAALCGSLGTAGIGIDAIVLLIQESTWKGATSFAFGLCSFALAVLISSWKAGWLQSAMQWMRPIAGLR